MHNGHKTYEAWNIALWINNTEELYYTSRDLVKLMGAKIAANVLFEYLEGKSTPDGVKYNKRDIFLAVKDLG